MLRAGNRVGAKEGWTRRERGQGNRLSLGALSHPRRLVPRSCSAATGKLNSACAYWEALSQPCFCYCVRKNEHCPDYVALPPLLSTSNESDVFQTSWPDDGAH